MYHTKSIQVTKIIQNIVIFPYFLFANSLMIKSSVNLKAKDNLYCKDCMFQTPKFAASSIAVRIKKGFPKKVDYVTSAMSKSGEFLCTGRRKRITYNLYLYFKFKIIEKLVFYKTLRYKHE